MNNQCKSLILFAIVIAILSLMFTQAEAFSRNGGRFNGGERFPGGEFERGVPHETYYTHVESLPNYSHAYYHNVPAHLSNLAHLPGAAMSPHANLKNPYWNKNNWNSYNWHHSWNHNNGQNNNWHNSWHNNNGQNNNWHNNWNNNNWHNNWNSWNYGYWNNYAWGYWNFWWGPAWGIGFYYNPFVYGPYFDDPYWYYSQSYYYYPGNYLYSYPLIINNYNTYYDLPQNSVQQSGRAGQISAAQSKETWVTVRNGDIPDSAVINMNANGQVTYYCRTKYMNKMNYGELIPNDGCYIDGENVTMRFTNYQVLISQ